MASYPMTYILSESEATITRGICNYIQFPILDTLLVLDTMIGHYSKTLIPGLVQLLSSF